jgi:hypothetical protein
MDLIKETLEIAAKTAEDLKGKAYKFAKDGVLTGYCMACDDIASVLRSQINARPEPPATK